LSNLFISVGALAKNGSFGFAKGCLVYRAKPNVPFVRWQFFLLCRVVNLFIVLFLALHPTVCSYTQVGLSRTKLSYEELLFKFSTYFSFEAQNPHLRIGAVELNPYGIAPFKNNTNLSSRKPL
jgi:hypothetical protein